MQAVSLWWRRVRWRRSGAWQWPTFAVLTFLDAAVMVLLPFQGDGPDPLGALLLAGFFNLCVVTVAAPLAGFALRRRRPDLPKLVARDHAGTGLLLVMTVALVLGGVAHRSARAAQRADERAVLAGVHNYVLARAPGYRAGLTAVDAVRVEDELYRACVPGRDPKRWLCLYVSTAQRPAGVTLDADRLPNDADRQLSGIR